MKKYVGLKYVEIRGGLWEEDEFKDQPRLINRQETNSFLTLFFEGLSFMESPDFSKACICEKLLTRTGGALISAGTVVYTSCDNCCKHFIFQLQVGSENNLILNSRRRYVMKNLK